MQQRSERIAVVAWNGSLGFPRSDTGFLLPFLLFVAIFHAWPAAAQNTRPSGTFLVAADIHFNPMADASLAADLSRAEPEQWEAIFARSKRTAFSQYGEDTNWWLLQSSLDAMRTTLPHPAFIMIAGDILAHRFPSTFANATHDSNREDYRKFVLKTVQFLALEFRRRFPNSEILLTPGNNDEDCGNYSVEAGGSFLHDSTEIVRKLALGDDAFRKSWEQLGSYDIPHPNLRGVRIISLNTVFLAEEYHAASFQDDCAPSTSSAPGDLLTWLAARLGEAQQAHEKVWLMFHIPPGMDSFYSIQSYESALKEKATQASESLCQSALVPMMSPKWTAQFTKLISQYKDTVLATFAAHNHRDDFRLIDTAANQHALVLITPAVSPVYNENPAFRTVTFSKDGSLLDTSIYYLTNLELASKRTAGEWQREYTFSQQWKAPLNAAGMESIYDKVASQQDARAEWLKLYNVSSAVYMPPNSTAGLYCAIAGLLPETYGKCYCSAAATPRPNASGH